MKAELCAHGDFLTRSRHTPELFSEPCDFTLSNGVRVSITAAGIISFTPAKVQSDTKHIVLSCGVHGNETAPIELCDDWVCALLTEQLIPVHCVLFLFGNLPAMDIAQRFVEENMNRLFSGAHSDGEGPVNAERQRAKQLEQAITDFFAEAGKQRFHYDLHTAIRESKNEKFAVYPYLHGQARSEEQIAFLSACGVKTILLSQSPTTTFSYYSSHNHNAHAFTVELGKVQPFGQNDMTRFEAARQTITRLISEETLELEPVGDDVEIFTVNQVINKQAEDFVLHFADNTPNFTGFSKGTLLAQESGASYYAEHEGEAIVFPNANVAIGQRALLTVVPTTLDGQ